MYDSLEIAMATHSSTLAWRIPWTAEPGRLWSIASQRVGHDRSDLALELAKSICGFRSQESDSLHGVVSGEEHTEVLWEDRKHPINISRSVVDLSVLLCKRVPSHSVLSDFLPHHGCSPPGSSVHGILQARILEWVAISYFTHRAFSHTLPNTPTSSRA